MILKHKDREIDVDISHRLYHCDGPWWAYECEYNFVDTPDEYHKGTIEGDGEDYCIETLEDEDGRRVCQS